MSELTPEERSELGRKLGSIKTPAKTAAAAKARAARTAETMGGRPVRPLSEIPCTCGGGDTLDHKAPCLRGAAIKRRQKRGLL